MGHPDEGMIRAFLDGEAGGKADEVRAHLAGCGPCAELGDQQTVAWRTATDAIALLDVEPRLQTARRRVLDLERDRRKPGARIRRSLPKAASFVVLLTAGAAAALPGSPVRSWVRGGWEALSATGEAPQQRPQEGVGAEGAGIPSPATVGATISAGGDPVELRVVGFTEASSLRVLLVAGDQAGIFAGEGTRFRNVAGLLVASDPPGEVTIEIPLAATGVTVSVNGETYLRMTGRGLELLGPVRTQSPTEIRFGPAGSAPEPLETGG